MACDTYARTYFRVRKRSTNKTSNAPAQRDGRTKLQGSRKGNRGENDLRG
jgi:hypothetical protein